MKSTLVIGSVDVPSQMHSEIRYIYKAIQNHEVKKKQQTKIRNSDEQNNIISMKEERSNPQESSIILQHIDCYTF